MCYYYIRMKKSFYVLLFIVLGAIIGGIVAWSAELAYLSILEADALKKGIPDALGYVYNSDDPFDYVYVVFVVVGIIVGMIQGLQNWEWLYGDRMIIVKRRIHVRTFILYGVLTLVICALAYTTDTLDVRSFFEREKGTSLGLVSQHEKQRSFSSVSGIVLLSVSCEGVGRGREGRSAFDCVQPYSALFGVFQGGTIVKTVESTENGVFEVKLSPGQYALRPLPVTERLVSFDPIDFSLAEGEEKRFEVLFESI